METYSGVRDGWAGGSVVVDVVTRIAEVEGVDPIELPPLADTIDPVALERIGHSPRDEASIHFEYYGWNVAVRSNGQVTLGDADE